MTTVIGVSFKRAGKMYYFDPNGLEIHMGDQAIVETARGIECGDVVTDIREVEDEEVVQPLKPVIRVATEEDKHRIAVNTQKETEAFGIGQTRIAHHKLEMKLVDVEYTFDVSKIIFYFTANGRIDFRELVKDLASIFKTRIELRQIGVRDEAKMIGGLGSCGRPICCRSFLGDFHPVSIKMAKEQNLLLNPTKISGLCGRLMCCLKYEQDNYDEVYRRMPRVGKEVSTPEGRGVVADIAVIREKIKVRSIGKDGTMEYREYGFDQVQPLPKDGSVPVIVAAEPSQDEDDEAMGFEKQEQPVRSEKPEKVEKPEKPEAAEKTVKPEKGENDKPARPARRPNNNSGNRGQQRRNDAPKADAEAKPQQGAQGGSNRGPRPPKNRSGQQGGTNRTGDDRQRNTSRRDNRPQQRDGNVQGGIRTIPKEQRPAMTPKDDAPKNT